MKNLYLSVITAVLAGLLFAAPALAAEKAAPPVGQTVIREGDYAVELVKALDISAPEGETEAVNALAALGIAPDTGWIPDFPVTPDIVTQVQASVDSAADADRLPMDRKDADSALLALNVKLGLDINVAGEGQEGSGEYLDQTVINNYYYDEGPPVVTYYAPPPDYAYLYAWDPFPFWWYGYWFPGYYVLVDFDIVIFDNHRFVDRDDCWYYRDHDRHWGGRHLELSNHVADPATGRFVTIDPVSKHPFTRTSFKPIGAKSFGPVAHGGPRVGIWSGTAAGGTARPFNRESAERIFRRSAGASGSSVTSGSWSRQGFRRDYNRPSGGSGGTHSGPSGSNWGTRGFISRGSNDERGIIRPSGSPSVSAPAMSAPSGGFRGGESRGFSGGGRSFGGDGGGVRSFGDGGGGFSGRPMGGGGGWGGSSSRR